MATTSERILRRPHKALRLKGFDHASFRQVVLMKHNEKAPTRTGVHLGDTLLN